MVKGGGGIEGVREWEEMRGFGRRSTEKQVSINSQTGVIAKKIKKRGRWGNRG